MPTANLVSSVKSIGELVSAEYFGEVIEDESTFSLDTINPEERIVQFYKDLNAVLNDFVDDAEVYEDKKSIIDTSTLESLRDDYPDYYYLLSYVVAKDIVDSKNWVARKFRKGKMEWIEDKLIAKVNQETYNKTFDRKRRRIKALFKEEAYTQYRLYFFKLAKLEESNRKIKDKIIMIARGSIKAGFNFDELNDQNLIYDKGEKIVRLYGFHAEILDTIINPWFIPELKISGYEIINSPKYSDYSKVIEIKETCRHRLAEQAQQAGIIQQAQIYGHEVLENFFATLLNEPDIKVVFNDLPHRELLETITEDSIIDISEAIEIGIILDGYETAFKNQPSDRINELEFQKQIIINRVKACTFDETGNNFNPFYLEYARLEDLIDEYKISGKVIFNNDTLSTDDAGLRILKDNQDNLSAEIIYGKDTIKIKKTGIELFKYLSDSLPKKIAYDLDTLHIKDVVIDKLKYIKDTLSVTKAEREFKYTTHFMQYNLSWYPNNNKQFLADFNNSIALFAQLYNSKQNLFALYAYPEIKLNADLFDEVKFNDEAAINKIVTDNVKTNSNNPNDAITVINTETQRYLDDINTRPIKKLVHLFQ